MNTFHIKEKIKCYSVRIMALITMIVISQAAFSQNCVETTEAMTERLKTSIYYLADDRLEGRDAGTEGEKMAYSFIESQNENVRLKATWR